jgi:hypothetical protein
MAAPVPGGNQSQPNGIVESSAISVFALVILQHSRLVEPGTECWTIRFTREAGGIHFSK